MPKVTIKEASEMVGPSKATLHRDVKAGKLSVETDARGKTVVDTAELDRVYGLTENLNPSQPEPQPETLTPIETAPEHPEHAENLATIERLKSEVQRLNDRQDKLIDLLTVEQARNEKMLALPPPKPDKQFPSWLRIFGFGS